MMNPEQQRIAIAEACGWKGPHHPENIASMSGWWSQDRGIWWITPDGNRVMISDAPDYLNDLNAMHEAEKVFYDADYAMVEEYEDTLAVVSVYPMSATAAQRAEAFLKCLNLWRDE